MFSGPIENFVIPCYDQGDYDGRGQQSCKCNFVHFYSGARPPCSQLVWGRAGGGPGTFFSTHGNHLPWLSGVHGLKDFLCSAHLHESFDGRIYTYWSVLKSKFVHQKTQEEEHYRENPSNYELLTVRVVDRRAFLKMFRAQITVYCTVLMFRELKL